MELVVPIRSSSVQALADWVEYELLVREAGCVGIGDIVDALEDSGVAPPASTRFSDSASVGSARSLAQSAWAELENRKKELFEAWPFEIVGSSIVRRPEMPFTLYTLFSLLDSVISKSFHGLDIKPGDKIRSIFEEVVTHVLNENTRQMPGSRVIRFGFPSAQRKSFSKSVEDLAQEFGLTINSSALKQFSSSTQKDASLDVALRLGLASCSTEGAVPYCLIQCATGRDWKSKLCDLQLTAWNRYVNWNGPLTMGFAVPQLIKERSARDRIQGIAPVILFDRWVLSSMARANVATTFPRKRRVEDWIQKKLKALPRTS